MHKIKGYNPDTDVRHKIAPEQHKLNVEQRKERRLKNNAKRGRRIGIRIKHGRIGVRVQESLLQPLSRRQKQTS